ncbi:MAG: tripartite tricarboxylate transporter TctB family protein [Pseudohongiellaceae bacterium]
MPRPAQAATRRTFHEAFSRLPTLLLAAIGAVLILVGRDYRTGSLTAMGPGFMPVLLGALLLLLAAVLVWRELVLLPLPLRPVAAVMAGMLAWVLLAEHLGFFAAALAQILLSSLALPQTDRRLELLVAGALSLGAWLLFVRVLGLPLPAFGS